MLQLRIRFSDSLSNRFLDEHGLPLFESLSKLKESAQGITPGEISFSAGAVWREDYVRELNRRFPGMSYRVPTSYDSTVLGVIARLMGEVRRIERLEADHPARRLMDASTYQMKIEDESDATFTCMTTREEIVQQSGGAGIVRDDHPLYDRGPLASALFGHLGQGLPDIVRGKPVARPWTPATPFELISRLHELDAEQSHLRRSKSSEHDDLARVVQDRWMPVLKQQRDIVLEADAARWFWPGASIVFALKNLSAEQSAVLAHRGGLSPRSNLKGIAASKQVGRVTAKDVYNGAGARYMPSLRMPYGLFVKKGIKTSMVMGAIAKSGYVDVECRGDAALQAESRRLIEEAAVGPFTFGKKGIAYLEHVKGI